jgi:hypothetical protein
MNTTLNSKNSDVGLVCANIGPKERQKRLTVGAVGLAMGLTVFVALQAFTAPVWMNILTLPFFYLAASGFFQWKDRTCVGNVYRGVMNMDEGDQPVTDQTLKSTLAEQAKKVQLKSVLTAVGATAFTFFLSVI